MNEQIKEILTPQTTTLTKQQVEDNMTMYVDMLKHTGRDGMADLADWLVQKTDFFRAPAERFGHGAYMGGACARALRASALACHLANELGLEKLLPSAELACLLADVWKADAFKPTERRRKQQDGTWRTVRTFEFRVDSPQLGHGEKSLAYVQRFTKLSITEQLCIRWAAGLNDETISGNVSCRAQYFNAVNQCPLITVVNSAFTLSCALAEPILEPSP